MKAYLETSVLLRRLLGQPKAFADWNKIKEGATSELTRVEALRTLDRLRLQGKLSDAEVSETMHQLRRMLDAIDQIVLTPRILETASRSYPTVIGTLDAVHLASALLYQDENDGRIVLLTHDSQLAVAGRALGLEVQGVALPQ